MTLIIACLNSKYIHASLAPWCLLAGVREHSFKEIKAKVMESTVNADINQFAKSIIAENPDFVALSTYIWNKNQTLILARLIKESTNCKIILGGPEVAYCPKEILENHPFADFILSGEGEESLPDLLNCLFGKGNLENVSGLSYKEGNNIITIPEKPATGTPPSPYCQEFFENLRGRISYIEASRGCPYSCAFCLSGRVSPLRFFDIDRVKNDILLLSNSGTKTVKFVDRTFNANAKRANKILSFILENYGNKIPQGVCFHFEIAGDILKEDTLKLLSKMPIGAVQLEIGMQSFNEKTLAFINRKTDTARLVKNIQALVGFKNMHIHIDLIAGLPFEDLESFKKSFNIGYSLKPNMLQMGFLKLLYGADMRENPQKFPCDFNNTPPYEVTSTPYLRGDEILALKYCEDALERLYNSGRFLFTLSYLTEEIGLNPFELFYSFGNAVNGEGMKLWDYAERLYEFFKTKCDSIALRDYIFADLLASCRSVKIPDILRVADPLYKRLLNYFKLKTGNSVKICILYSSSRVYVVNYSKEKDFSGRYKGEFFSLECILKELDG